MLRLCKETRILIFEQNFILDDVHSADEVFVTGTFAGVIPVISVDGKIIGNGSRGNITKDLQHWYAQYIEILATSG